MIIELKNINKSYSNKYLFKNLDFSIKKGEMVAITGPSGVGKSTLLNIIGLIDKPDSGEVVICSNKNPFDKEKVKLKLFRDNIGYLFQNYALVDNYTVSKNLDIALEYVKNKNKKRLKEEALEKVGLLDKLNNKIFELSGGEQQRVALARLMLKEKDIILADEPTGSLDEDNRDIILKLLKQLNDEGKTIVLVTHDKTVANMCNREINIKEL
ncbi:MULTISPECIES: putative bacteriocin export ABC transporter [unclassified Clostridium]|uniref:putative bacteriocin export ABC transporter n=1 Tax=Clostridium TaxID=1485 RepID=UPI001C8BA2B9|nr:MULTISPECIES: putative bacteriocin export ABC transporter [unclassified Clostridium]MDU2290425.1 putative bacteriocin export ABC transporter [Clostridium celatum]MDU4323817.1 putative bacteriocin export ABC transporter [Clostridium celatum]